MALFLLRPGAVRRSAITEVTVVSSRRETIDDLRAYLARLGLSSRGASLRTSKQVESLTSQPTAATVIFPDEFLDEDILALIRVLRAKGPALLVVLITREPQRFREATLDDGRSTPAVILPKPSFGWDIIDIIRAHAARTAR